jgi:hypothetical protein
VAKAQKTTYIIDDTPVGLGISIIDEQSIIRKRNTFNALISRPTLIQSKKNERGELYVRLYINSDEITVRATKINSSNKNLYKAFQKVSFFADGKKYSSPTLFREELSYAEPEEGQRPHYIFPTSPAEERAVYEYSIVEVQSGKVVSTLTVEYAFPKPEPEILLIDKRTISRNEDRPSDNLYFDTASGYKFFKEQISSKNLVKTSFNPLTNVPEKLVLPQDINSLLIRFKTLKGLGRSDNYLEYKLSGDSTWKTTMKKRNPFIILRNLPVGKHKLYVRYPEQDDAVWEYDFEIKPVWTQTTFFKVFIGSFITAFFCFILFIANYKRQKRKLKKEVAIRKQLQTQITALRSQLHPHFIFNALNSIQGLMNKNNIEDANLYISKFGSLLHDILDKGDKTMHPLANEIRQVEYYLQLEQLRFRFDYNITIDNTLNISEIDIPVMLLQPYVENAIKHGIIEKREAGIIELKFEKQDNNLLITIRDNGKGYDTNAITPGHGNTLIEERVNALNKYLEEQQIDVKVASIIGDGTCVTIFFNNWL